jgi:uncharacterized BrkB/YihY/UPF0761 family membrane protein
LFPLLLLLTDLFGYFAQGPELRASLLDYFHRVVPGSAYRLAVDTPESDRCGRHRMACRLFATV